MDKKSKINNPDILDIVTHGGIGQKSKKYPSDIIIEGLNGDIWEWRRILPGLKIGKLEKGVSDFYRCQTSYDRIVSNKNGKFIIESVQLSRLPKATVSKNMIPNINIIF